VPIYRLIEKEAFEPEDVALMCNVFEELLQTLRLSDREDPVATLVARKVIELAQTGVREEHWRRRVSTSRLRPALYSATHFFA
jgi:hypothetical protein